MAEHTTTKLNPDSHIPLDQALLRLPHELVRRNFKNVQRYVERERDHVLPTLKETANSSISSSDSPDSTLASLDAMLSRMQTLKRRLEALQVEEEALHDHSSKRLRHLQDLYEIPSLVDVKYDQWSRKRLDRLIVDYFLRTGHVETATALAEAKDITHLIDLDIFTASHKISASLEEGKLQAALAWVAENRVALRKLLPGPNTTTGQPPISDKTPQISDLEFQLRLQQFIEMIRTGTTAKKLEAMQHASKYISPFSRSRPKDVSSAGGLLAQDPNTKVEPYRSLFSPSRWTILANLFTQTHHSLFSLPAQPLLHTALSAGLSALKTPACHSVHNPASSSTPGHARIAANTSLCPICSTELNELARSVPYAHHTKSYVENNPVVLPNGRVYGRERLEELQRKIVRAAGGGAAAADKRRRGIFGAKRSPVASENANSDDRGNDNDDGDDEKDDDDDGNGNGDGANTDNTHMKDRVVTAVDEDRIGVEGEVTDPTTGETFPWEEVKKVYIT